MLCYLQGYSNTACPFCLQNEAEWYSNYHHARQWQATHGGGKTLPPADYSNPRDLLGMQVADWVDKMHRRSSRGRLSQIKHKLMHALLLSAARIELGEPGGSGSGSAAVDSKTRQQKASSRHDGHSTDASNEQGYHDSDGDDDIPSASSNAALYVAYPRALSLVTPPLAAVASFDDEIRAGDPQASKDFDFMLGVLCRWRELFLTTQVPKGTFDAKMLANWVQNVRKLGNDGKLPQHSVQVSGADT